MATTNNIEFNEIYGTYSFVENTRNDISWHRLGQKFDEPLTAAQAIDACNADFTVTKQPIAALSQEIMSLLESGCESVPASMIQDLIIKSKVATVRDDSNKPLGIVSSSYGVVQNKDAFAFLDKIITCSLGSDEEHPVIECAGLLGDGERVFVTVKFPDTIQLDDNGEDLVDMYLVFTTSHDGSGAVKCMVTPIRVASNASLNLSMLRCTGKISMRHSSNIMNRMDLTNLDNATMAYQSLNLYKDYKDALENTVKELKAKKLTQRQVENIVANMLFSEEQYKIFLETRDLDAEGISTNAKNKFNKAIETLHHGIGQSLIEKYTGLWVINGLTTLYQNGFKPTSSEVFFNSVSDGYIYNKIQKAYQAILKA